MQVMQKKELIIAAIFILAGVGTSLSFGYISTTRPLTNLEGVVFQIMVLLFSLTGSYWFGKQAAIDGARELIRPHARSSFRRLLSLYRSLSTQIAIMENCDTPDDYPATFASLKVIVHEQIYTADDALDDWADIVPDDVAELRKEFSEKSLGGISNGH